MSDRLFTGRDVEQALQQAEALLGLPREQLRFVVLDPGEPGRYGGQGREARVAVLLQDAGRAAADRPERGNEAVTTAPGVADVLRVLQEEAGLQVTVTVHEAGDTVEIDVDGPDEAFLTAGPSAEALEHLLQRAASREAAAPRRVFLGGAGARRRREAELEQLARDLAERARQEGRAQLAPPLNSYERRVVHMLLAGEPGIRTRSEGEGRERRLRVEPSGEPPPAEPGGSAAAG